MNADAASQEMRSECDSSHVYLCPQMPLAKHDYFYPASDSRKSHRQMAMLINVFVSNLELAQKCVTEAEIGRGNMMGW